MSDIYNFSAGPAMLPQSVLAEAQAEMLDWQGTGVSVMSMSHRGKAFTQIAEQAEADLRELLSVPEDYDVLFMQGGASMQFAAVALNLAAQDSHVDYVNTGVWSKKAMQEAARYTEVSEVIDAAQNGFASIPEQSQWQLNPNASYCHYTSNETIGGLEFHWTPDVGNVPLVCDMSSNILSKPVDVSRYGLIYMGAQKNIGPAGLTITIIRRDLLERTRELGRNLGLLPTTLQYSTYADNNSMYNTPPTYAWYIAGLVFQWLKQQGGLSAIDQQVRAKAKKLYAMIDGSDFYNNAIAVKDRSRMNIPFTLANPDLEEAFLSATQANGLLELRGHRSFGGMRASLYNAMPEAGVDKLIAVMRSFEAEHA